jgi:hypothetical protein
MITRPVDKKETATRGDPAAHGKRGSWLNELRQRYIPAGLSKPMVR